MIPVGFMCDSLFNNTALPGPVAGADSFSDVSFSDMMNQSFNASHASQAVPSAGAGCATAPGSQGHGQVEALKQQLMSAGVDLDEVVADEAALAELEQILVQAGFKKGDVAAMMTDLKASAQGKGIRLSDLFARLSELQETSPEDSSENLLAISALPYLESILAQLGLTPEQMAQALGQAQIEGQGVDLEKLVAGLKQILEQLPGGGLGVADENSQGRIRDLMERLGMVAEGADRGWMSLAKFVSRLQEMSERNGAGASASEAFGLDLNRFVQKLRLNPKGGGKHARPAVDTSGLKQPFQAELNQASSDSGKPSAAPQSMAHQEGLIKQARIEVLRGGDDAGLAMGQPTQRAAADAKGAAIGPKSAGQALPAYMLDQVARQLSRSIRSGDNVVQLQLKPPALGRLKLHIATGSQGIEVKILAEQLATRDMLLSHSGEIKSALLDQGLRLDKVDVQLSHDFEQSLADARQDARRQSGRKRPSKRTVELPDSVATDLQTPAPGQTEARGLDLVA